MKPYIRRESGGSGLSGRDRNRQGPYRYADSSVKLQAEADRSEIPADGSDIAYVEICLTDEAGNLNPEVDKAVSISAEGPGTILGYGSADPDSEENYFDTTAKLLKEGSGRR